MFSLLTQTLQSNVGLNVAQAKSDSVGVKEIEAFIEKDVPQVREPYNIIRVLLYMRVCYYY